MNKILAGVIMASLISGLLIFSIEEHYSFLQILFGFLVFIVPACFISSFKSRGLSFILSFVSILFAYVSYHFELYNTWVGVVMALTIGLPVFFYRIRQANVSHGHALNKK